MDVLGGAYAWVVAFNEIFAGVQASILGRLFGKGGTGGTS